MPTPQPGIFALGTRSHVHLEFDVDDAVGADALGAALARLREPAVTAGGCNLVVGFGDALWRRVAPPGAVPDDLVDFPAVDGLDGHGAPSTQHDLWVWIHGTGEDIVLDTALAVRGQLADVATLAHSQQCFVYKDSRDLTGFIDGTANPAVAEALDVAVIPAGHPGAGGSLVLTQQWVHDLAAFHALDVADQEAVIGRTKPDSVGLRPKPTTSHVSRMEIETPDGGELQLWRRSTPWANLDAQGLWFIAFSAELDRYTQMFARMFGLADGVRDHLTDFSRPVTGAYYLAPSIEDLQALEA